MHSLPYGSEVNAKKHKLFQAKEPALHGVHSHVWSVAVGDQRDTGPRPYRVTAPRPYHADTGRLKQHSNQLQVGIQHVHHFGVGQLRLRTPRVSQHWSKFTSPEQVEHGDVG